MWARKWQERAMPICVKHTSTFSAGAGLIFALLKLTPGQWVEKNPKNLSLLLRMERMSLLLVRLVITPPEQMRQRSVLIAVAGWRR